MPVNRRQQALIDLAEKPKTRVILISLRCGSNGYAKVNPIISTSYLLTFGSLNLTAANNVFLMEPQWNPMLEEQALDRVYRIGQTKKVTTISYIVKGTLEEVSIAMSHIQSDRIMRLIEFQSIRQQQAKKRNLAEHAFTMAKHQDDWLEVSTDQSRT